MIIASNYSQYNVLYMVYAIQIAMFTVEEIHTCRIYYRIPCGCGLWGEGLTIKVENVSEEIRVSMKVFKLRERCLVEFRAEGLLLSSLL